MVPPDLPDPATADSGLVIAALDVGHAALAGATPAVQHRFMGYCRAVATRYALYDAGCVRSLGEAPMRLQVELGDLLGRLSAAPAERPVDPVLCERLYAIARVLAQCPKIREIGALTIDSPAPSKPNEDRGRGGR